MRLALIALIAPQARRRSRRNSMRSLFLATLTLLVFAAPVGALLTDDEPNDTIADAAENAHIVKTGPVTTDAGELELVAGDIDFLGISALSAGDIVTVTTTPLEDPPDFEQPDTIVGLFDSTATDPTTMILCRGDNTRNDDLQNCPGGNCVGRGSLCRFLIEAPGDYYVGVTGFRPKNPGGCVPGVNCISFPFDGGIGGTPCEESGGDSLTCGSYQLTIGISAGPTATPTSTPTATPTPTPTPEPGGVLQLVWGGVGLAWLQRRRSRRVRARTKS
jgi:hypothetical protein